MVFNLLAAVAPAVVGGLFSSHAQKKQNRSNQKQAAKEREVALEDDASRFVRLRDAAVAGGFNPLTALQFGGTTMGFGSGTVANQVFDWGPTASAAMTAALPEISGQADVARQREVLEQDLLKVQADALRTSTVATQSAINAAQAFRPIGSYSGGGSGGSGMAGPAVAAGITSGTGGNLATNREVTELTYRGHQFETDPYTDDVDQSLEPRYGDIVSSVGGIGVLGADIYHNLRNVPLLPQSAPMFNIESGGLADRAINGISSLFGTKAVDNVTVHRQQSSTSQFAYPPARWATDPWSH